MKKLTSILVSTVLLTTLVQAKDKDFKVNITPINLNIGQNQIKVSIRSKTIPVNDAKVKLKVYKSGNILSTHITNRVNKNGKYIFNVNIPTKAKYTYLLRFNKMGGVNHIRRGNFEVR